MALKPPPPPVKSEPGTFAWFDWYRKLYDYLNSAAIVAWTSIDFAGSKLTDIATRLHSNLQGILGNGEYHLSLSERNSLFTLTWFNASLVNSWGSAGAGSAPPGYAITADKIVRFRGVLTGGTSGTLAMTLPVGFRPVYETFLATSVTSLAYVQIHPNGEVYPVGSVVSFDGLSFPAI